ncbi:restriction endonuclease [Streptomyces sp. NRRL S-118]|uniref:restriction endonuclease n=1 Tax=Streptomyces sp. NRRL S-118 TaxID=1463881 RepID=UPI0004C84233|nr:restriction endonuclease [Streptomyces sp. NRRL S-118]
MAISARRPRPDRPVGPDHPAGPSPRRPRFSLRDTVLGFGLVAILLCGTGMTARAAVRDTADVPAAALALAGTLAVVAALVRFGLRRRAGTAGPLLPAAAEAVADPEAPPYAALDYTAMDPAAFEKAVAELCVRDGCLEVEVVGGAGDLGADVLATTPDGRRVVVQCKAYAPDHKVGSQDLQRFGGTCFAVHGAHVAAVVTTSEFTEPALQYAEQCGILCMDGHGLDAWTRGTGPAPWHLAPLPAEEH